MKLRTIFISFLAALLSLGIGILGRIACTAGGLGTVESTPLHEKTKRPYIDVAKEALKK